jgi:hypothetical protein
MCYTLKTTNTYRVSTVDEALRLRKWLEKNATGELTSFTYTNKDIKEKGEVIESYVVVKANFVIDNEKEPEGIQPITVLEVAE